MPRKSVFSLRISSRFLWYFIAPAKERSSFFRNRAAETPRQSAANSVSMRMDSGLTPEPFRAIFGFILP
jgi:hypothetical protein